MGTFAACKRTRLSKNSCKDWAEVEQGLNLDQPPTARANFVFTRLSPWGV